MNPLKKIKKKIQQKDEARISQIITEFSSDFLVTAGSGQPKQTYLNCACTAWNLALFPAKEIEGKLDLIVEEYKKNNPKTNDAENYRHNILQLIARKKKLYPHVKLSVVDASILEEDGNIWIKVASAPFNRKAQR